MPIPSPLAFPPTALRNVAAGLVVGNPIGSSGTRGKALTAAELKAIVEASGISYLPLSGGTLTGALSLGSNGFTCGAITASGAAKFNNYSASKYWQFETGANGIFRYYSAAGPSYNFQIMGDSTGSGGSPRVMFTSGGSIEWGDNASSISVSTMDLILKRANAGVLAQRNGINAQCFLLNKTYTSDASQEALMLDAGKQISGKLGLYSYRGTSGGSNYPIQIGMLASNGTTFSGLTVGTDGVISTAWDNGGTQAINCGNNIGLTQFGQHFLLGNKFGGATYYYVDVDANTGNLRLPSVGCFGITSGNAYSGTMDVTLSRNAAGIFQIGTTAANASGSLLLTNLTASGVTKIILPSSDPHILGCLWNNSGTITISAG